MSTTDSDGEIRSLSSPDRSRLTRDVEATMAYCAADPAPEVGTRRFAFLGPPRGEDELGWLSHYRVRSLIGEGAIGLVFLAEDTNLARPVALKVIKPELAGAPRVRSRFVREAQATAAIKHDHIVTIYQVGEDRGVLFLAMDYLQGVSLQQWLDRGRKPSLDLVLRIGREMASGLAAAHKNGLIHRDIKPANVWLETPSGRVKILDFGMARSERDNVQMTQAGTVVGTPAYMAPEQARGETAGASTDLFSLGCVLYRLYAGRSPFEGKTILAVLSALAFDIPRPLREIDPEIRPGLDALVTRLLAKNPDARPASAQAVVDEIRAIERALLAERQSAKLSEDTKSTSEVSLPTLPRAGTVEPPPQKGRKIRRLALGLSAAVLGVIVVTFVILRLRPAEQIPATRLVTLDPALDAKPTKEPLPSLKEVYPEPVVQGEDGGAPPQTATATSTEPSQTAERANTDERSTENPRNAQDTKRKGETEKEQAASAPSRPKVALVPNGPASERDDWGAPVDPDGDCRISLDPSKNEVRIDVPGTPHVLAAELGRVNAPRLLRPVQGDFEATVKVAGVFHPAGRATLKEYAPYHGAGILLWQDDRNYVRLEIATELHKGKPRRYANFELRKAGLLAVSNGLTIKDGSTQLRLERRGEQILAAFSSDGVRWTAFPPLTAALDDRLSVGVIAISSAAKPLNAVLEMFAITRITQSGDGRREGYKRAESTEARTPP